MKTTRLFCTFNTSVAPIYPFISPTALRSCVLSGLNLDLAFQPYQLNRLKFHWNFASAYLTTQAIAESVYFVSK